MVDMAMARERALVVIRFAVQQVLGERSLLFARNSAEVEVEVSHAVMGLVCRVAYDLLGKQMVQEDSTQVPADWWSHLKSRWFPRWWLRRWPARTRKITTLIVNRVCPHVDVKLQGRHFHWLEYGDTTGMRGADAASAKKA